MNKGAKINAFLLSIGASPEVAYMEAQRLEKTLFGSKSPTSTHKRVPSAGLCVQPTLKERVISYSDSQNGREWSLAGCALALQANPNSISAQLTHLLKAGLIFRSGPGRYVKNSQKK